MYRFWPPKFEQREIQKHDIKQKGPKIFPLKTIVIYYWSGTIRGPSGNQGEFIRHPFCRVFKLKKSKKRKIRIFEKPDFPVRIRIRWYRNIRGVTLRSQEVQRSEKKRKKIFRIIRIYGIRISGSTSMALRWRPKGLPVAKISDL